MTHKNSGKRDSRLIKNTLLSLLVIPLFFAGIELILYTAGFEPFIVSEDPYVGFSSSVPHFVEYTDDEGRTYLTTSNSRVHNFNKQTFVKEKLPETYRVFCLGGSTTYGRPYKHEVSFCGWLEEFLNVLAPDMDWQIINVGGISYASYRVAKLMEELASYGPDLFIVYSGHNEFLEERTFREIIEIPDILKNANVLLGRTRTYSYLRKVVRNLRSTLNNSHFRVYEMPETVEEKLDRTIGPETYTRNGLRREHVVAHYRAGLSRMVGISRKAGSDIMFIMPASNLKDMSPFKSEHKDSLTGTELERWTYLYKQGLAMSDAGDYVRALDIFNKALNMDDRYAELWFMKGKVLYKMGRFDQAWTAFQRAADEDIAPIRMISELGRELLEIAELHDLPVLDFQELIEKHYIRNYGHNIAGKEMFLDHVHPTIEANRLLGISLLGFLKDEGIVTLKQILNKDTVLNITRKVEGRLSRRDHAMALRNLGRILGWAGKLEEGHRLTLQALELLGEDVDTLVMLGLSSKRMKKYDDALEFLLRALDTEPDAADAHNALGELYLEMELHSEAAEHFAYLINKMPKNARMNYLLASAKEGMGEFEGAIIYYLKSLEFDPDLSESHDNIANLFFKLGDHRRAMVHYKEMVRIEPANSSAHANLGVVQAGLSEFADAERSFRRALQIEPDLADGYNGLGFVAEHSGDIDRAVKYYGEAVRLDPESSDSHNNYGTVLAKKGELDLAITQFREALRLNPGLRNAKDNLHTALKQKNETGK